MKHISLASAIVEPELSTTAIPAAWPLLGPRLRDPLGALRYNRNNPEYLKKLLDTSSSKDRVSPGIDFDAGEVTYFGLGAVCKWGLSSRYLVYRCI